MAGLILKQDRHQGSQRLFDLPGEPLPQDLRFGHGLVVLFPPLHVLVGGAQPQLLRAPDIVGQAGNDGNGLDAGPLEQAHRRGVALEPLRQFG